MPYFNSLREIFLNKNFIQSDYEACLVKPHSNQLFWSEEDRTLKCTDILILHNSSIYSYSNVLDDEDQDITIFYKFIQDSTVFYFDDKYFRRPGYSGYGRFMPNLIYYFAIKEDHDRKNIQGKVNKFKEENIIKNNLINRFGKEYGILIFNHEVKIGMTKKMCDAAWGETSNRRKFIDGEGESEVCQYSKGTLVFRNGILTKIIY